MNVHTLTADYEAWMGRQTDLYMPDLDHKHAEMRGKNPFPFFRGTYFLWAKRWPMVCPELLDGPAVLAVGDLHVENFGTWRDADGRLCWGVNDFDEADELAYTHDLVRLAASVRFARSAGDLDARTGEACQAILAGYRKRLKLGGRPFVLEERNRHLRALAMAADREPKPFWEKLETDLIDPDPGVPDDARAELIRLMPDDCPRPKLYRRVKAGMGSLGRPRYVALADWAGGKVAREAKAVLLPATAWATGTDRPNRASEAAARAVRCRDLSYQPGPVWVVRRLAPRSSKIELATLQDADVGRLLRAMGAETANVHVGTEGAAERILDDLRRRPGRWLEESARAMADALAADWRDWRKMGEQPSHGDRR